MITAAVGRGRRITPAAEWFIDNWPLLEEQIRTARLHLPRGYSRELPRLTTTTASTTTGHTASTMASTTSAVADAATPRVYQLAIELVSHSHGRIDADALRAFIAAYQSVTPLRLGELWAVPIMLRLALLEDLRRVVANITAGRRDRERARSWIKKMIDVPDDHREAVVLVLADLVREAPALSDAFVAELATRLQARGPTLAIAMSWLEQRLAERGESVTQVFQRASQSQAADQVSIGNSIGGLRFLSATDWQTFVEDLNVVDIALRADPAGIYARMDFATRDRYRHAVEAFARRSTVARHDERAVADVAVRLADEARARSAPSVQHHVGYWLIDDGERALADAVGFDVDLHEARRRFATRHALPIYTIGITALTLLLTAATVSAPARFGTAFVGGALIVVVPLLVLALSQLATAAVQWRVTRRMTPHVLPRLDFAAGIPAGEATLVAVPCLLTDVAEIDDLVEALELRFLANRTAHLTFALVSDFKDAATAHVVGDDVLLARARAGIDRLNAAHAGTGGDDDGARLFFLLHRPRRFNAADDAWMGEERKRGKLEDLNRALRGARGRFDADSAADVDVLARSGIRSVIVLDSDTQLPRDAGRLLVATMAHPLNTPVYDEALGRVVRGYSILQPRVGVSMASTARSRFARLFAGEPGIDPYTRAVSDVYQDLFSQGSFVGKGIYDVDMVQRALAGRFPDNRVLSHDLLESAYARCGLVTDVMLIEEQPAAHGVDLSRRARWVRGDWQIASWLLPRVPAGTDVDKRHPLSALSRWKVADNLRRSIVPAALLALLVIGWCSALPIAVALTIAVLAVVFVPGSFSTLTALVRRPEQVAFSRYAPDVLRELGRQLVRDGLALAWLPIDAVLGLDSMIRALVRLTITHRLLLEWRTAADAGRAAQRSVGGAYRALWTAPFIAVAIAVVVVVQQPSSAPLAAPVLLLWLLGPLLSSWLSVPTTMASSDLSADDVRWLRGVARRTWRFFAVFTTTADHDLVPDNFQEDPPRGIAHRTSPTNIGLGLTATLAAHDFGWIGLDDVVARCTRTLATLEELPRHRGHFYNWYDTQTLEPLLPLYVSTVDSGNLAGHLITLAAGLDAFVDGPGHRVMLLAGLRDTFALVERARVATPTIAAIDALLREAPRGVIDTHDVLVRLTAVVEVAHIGADDDDRNQHADADVWAVALREQVAAAVVEITTLHPWLTSLAWLTPKQRAVLDRSWSLAAIAAGAQRDALRALVDGDDANAGAGASTAVDVDVDVEIARAVDAGAARAVVLVDALRALATHARALSVMEAGFLYDKSRRLLSIGKNVVDGRIDQSFYDLLASEARLASYIAVARGQLAQEHWFSLGRSLTTSGNTPALLSWSGSMFEYLMPLLIMPTWPRTLLDETCRGVVKRQIAWGLDHDAPWGVSESGYAKTDAALNYQYRAFGVAGLGYKRGLADDVVVAPYATVMAM
ncbi:MAG TPA: cyclic beta 1-2 glucan synthetase, partial [Myxococcota bacterium]